MKKPTEEELNKMHDRCAAIIDSGKGDLCTETIFETLQWVLGLTGEAPDVSYLED